MNFLSIELDVGFFYSLFYSRFIIGMLHIVDRNGSIDSFKVKKMGITSWHW